jgi:hypothetical protein
LETRRSSLDAAANVGLAALIVVSVVVSGAVIYSLPAQTENQSVQSTASSPASTSTAAAAPSTSNRSIVSSSTSYTTVSSPTVTLTQGNRGCLDFNTTLTFGQITIIKNPCVSYSFGSSERENLTLTNPQVFPILKTAYWYSVVYVKYNPNHKSIMDFVLNVTGTQIVNGNWSTAYSISYTGNKMVNVTMQPQTGGGYELLDVVVVSLPDRNYTNSFTLEQRQIIQTALSNSTVKGLMVGPPYYVREVTPFNNGSGFGQFFVWLFQVNGIREVGAFVTGNITGVVSAYSSNRVSVECFSDNSCFVDPWGVDPNDGIAREPFYVYITYGGPWTANVSIYNSGQPYGKQVYNRTFNGDGNDTLMIPFQDVVGYQTILVTAQKLDDGTGVLALSINLGPGEYPGGGSQKSSTNQFRGTTSAYFTVG